EGFNRYVDEKIADIGTNAFSIQKFSIEDFSSVAAFDEARRRNKDISLDDFAALKAARGGAIRDVGAKAFQSGELRHGSEVLFEVRIVGATSNIIDIDRGEIAEGRHFTQAEEEHNRSVCYIGADIAERFFPSRSGVGE